MRSLYLSLLLLVSSLCHSIPPVFIDETTTTDLSPIADHWSASYHKLQERKFPVEDLSAKLLEINSLLANLTINDFIQTPAFEDGISQEWNIKKLAYQRQHRAYNNLLNVRRDLLHEFPEAAEKRLMGFGPQGIQQILIELKSVKLSTQLTTAIDYRSVIAFMSETRISPVPLAGTFIQLLFILAGFWYWRKKGLNIIIESLSSHHAPDKRDIINKIVDFYLTIHKPLERGLLIYLIIVIALDTVQSLHQNIIIHTYLQLWAAKILQCSGCYLFSFSSEKIKTLNIRTFKLLLLYVLSMLITYSAINFYHINEAVLAHNINNIFILIGVVTIIYLLHIWRDYTFTCLQKPAFSNNRLLPWIEGNKKGLKSYVLVLLGLLYLAAVLSLRYVINKASRYEAVNLWLTYLFRIEVARQHSHAIQNMNLQLLPESELETFSLGFESQVEVSHVDDALKEKVERLSFADRASICLLHAPKGSGKTVLLQQLTRSEALVNNGHKSLYIRCPNGGFSTLIESLAIHLSLDKELGEGEEFNSARAVVNALKDMPNTLICIDDIHHLVTPSIGGLQELDRLVRLMRRASGNIAWVLSIDSSAWRFVERARGERFLFDLEEMLPKWNEKSIAELITQRVEESKLELDISNFIMPKQINQNTSEGDITLTRYSSILWEYSAGNPGVALQLLSQSLFHNNQETRKKTASLHLFDINDDNELTQLSVTLLLILRAIMQMEYAAKDDIARCANVSTDEVIDALRLLRSKGFVLRNGHNEYYLNWFYYRDITTILSRQHLLAL